MPTYDKATAIQLIRKMMVQYGITFDELISAPAAPQQTVTESVKFDAHPAPAPQAAPAAPKKWFEVDNPVISDAEALDIVSGYYPEPSTEYRN